MGNLCFLIISVVIGLISWAVSASGDDEKKDDNKIDANNKNDDDDEDSQSMWALIIGIPVGM